MTPQTTKIDKNVSQEPRVNNDLPSSPKPRVILNNTNMNNVQPRPVTPLSPNLTPRPNSFQELLQQPLRVPTRIVPRSLFPRFNSTDAVQQPHWVAQHIFDDTGKKLSLDALLSGPDSGIWKKSISNELGRLSDGIPGRVRGTKAVKWIYKNQVPKTKE